MKKNAVLSKISDLIFYIVGCGIYSVAVVMFVTPAKMSPGGVTGIATVFDYLTGVPVGVTVFIVNVPLIIIAFFKLGKSLVINTAVATAILSASLTVAEITVKKYEIDPILSALFGGMLMGVGLGLVLLRSATTGGFDIIVKLISNKFPHISLGNIYMLLDASVILLAVICYGNIESALYSAICIYTMSKAIDFTVYGSYGGKLILTVTSKPEEVKNEIMLTVKRGITKIKAVGGYTGDERSVLMCAVRKYEAARILSAVKRADSNAFSVITDAGEISGLGFEK